MMTASGTLQPGEARFRKQFDDDDVTIGEFRSRPLFAGQSEDRCSSWFHIGVVRQGAMGLVEQQAANVGIPGAGRIFWAGEEYQFTQSAATESVSTGVYVEEDLFREMLGRTLGFDPASPADLPERDFDLTADQYAGLTQFAAALDRKTSWLDPVACKEMGLLLVAQAIDAVSARCARGADQVPQRDRRVVAADVRAVLVEQYAGHLTLEIIARQVHVSQYHLCRLFRRETGRSIHQELEWVRLCAAAHRILQGDDRMLSDIAIDVGFANRGHLGDRFARTFGVPPSRFRSRAGMSADFGLQVDNK